jgi:hypothetical protein
VTFGRRVRLWREWRREWLEALQELVGIYPKLPIVDERFAWLQCRLMIRGHGSLEVATAIKLAEELAFYDIAWFEEPASPAWSTTKVRFCPLIAEASAA